MMGTVEVSRRDMVQREHMLSIDGVVPKLSRDIAIFLSGDAGVLVKAAGTLGQKS